MRIMRFGILGPLEVFDDNGAPVHIPGGRRRALLIALLTQPNDVICVDRLLEWMWHADLPRCPIPTLQVHISMLRRVLEPGRPPRAPATVLITQAPGYLLRVPQGQLDTVSFEELLRKGRMLFEQGDAEHARLTFVEALALWRGDPLVDVVFHDAAQTEIHRLEELRLTTLALRIEADLMLGRHQEVIPELTRLAATYPFHEQFHAGLMEALSRCGRRSDALNVYRRAQETLAREMGLSPGPELRKIEAAILHDTPGAA
jgi:DNA-binding SARP family transcriptional activator